MLRIKDNVDLKELEKYGFVNYNEEQDFKYIDLYKYIGDGRRGQVYYWYINTNKTISIYSSEADGNTCETLMDDTLFDMIQDGIVEKVKE